MNPMVSVIMSVHNGEKYLRQTIDSILNQTYSDFEFIIINDGSTDNTQDILTSYDDKRIKLIQQKNIGLTKSLNKGIKLAKGKYIGRMDADDLSLPKRIAEQLKFMEMNTQVGIVGCWYYLIDEENKIIKEYMPPTESFKIKKALMYSASIIHPGMMIRKKSIEEINYYNEQFVYAQDRDLLFRMVKYNQLAVIPQFLVKFRHHNNSIGIEKELEQKRYCLKAMNNAIGNGIYSKIFYLYTLRLIISLKLPPTIRYFKNRIFNKLGLRHDM